MEYTTLGRTGLRVSRMGLGCGGHSRLGLAYGRSEEQAAHVVQRAIDLGINFIDTAEGYGTELAVGHGFRGVNRDSVIISTKAGIDWQDRRSTSSEMRTRVEACLTRLNTDRIDLFNLHGVLPDDYHYSREELVPALQGLQREGKIRFIGITEQFLNDTSHVMLQKALKDNCWDVMMIGFSILNQSARQTVFPQTQAKNIGTLGMFAVRTALSRPDVLRKLMQVIVERGMVEQDDFDADDPLGFAWKGHASSLEEAAYRFCRWEPGIDVVLSGTGNLSHLEENARSINGDRLPDDVTERLRALFARVDSVSGN